MSRDASFADVAILSFLDFQGQDIPLSDPPLPWDPDYGILGSDGLSPFNSSSKQKHTSFPLLLVNTALDPVCPLSGALKMARKSASAGLL